MKRHIYENELEGVFVLSARIKDQKERALEQIARVYNQKGAYGIKLEQFFMNYHVCYTHLDENNPIMEMLLAQGISYFGGFTFSATSKNENTLHLLLDDLLKTCTLLERELQVNDLLGITKALGINDQKHEPVTVIHYDIKG